MRIFLIALLLIGCAQPQPKRNIYEASANECENYGFTKGTDAYSECMQREVQHRREIGMKYIKR
jgi:PBP1b-binding outer membrane lipoprotein LpoB